MYHYKDYTLITFELFIFYVDPIVSGIALSDPEFIGGFKGIIFGLLILYIAKSAINLNNIPITAIKTSSNQKGIYILYKLLRNYNYLLKVVYY